MSSGCQVGWIEASAYTLRAMGSSPRRPFGRVWLMATVVALVGIALRTAGLSSAILLAALFTISIGAVGMAYLLKYEARSLQPR